MANKLTHTRLLEMLEYNPETGLFTKKVTLCRWKAGTISGGRGYDGYKKVYVDKVPYRSARLVWFYMTKEWPKQLVDHINGDRTDDRWCNLREANFSENGQNRTVKKNSSSGYLGVYYHKSRDRWCASIQVDGKEKFLGRFKDKEDAREAYCLAKSQLHQFNPEIRSSNSCRA